MRTTNTRTTTFNKGDIVVRTDATFPEGAMVVDGYDETGRLLAHTVGGGLQYTIGSHEGVRGRPTR